MPLGGDMKKLVVLTLVLALCMVGVAGARPRANVRRMQTQTVQAATPRTYTIRMMHNGEPAGYLTPRLAGPYPNGEWLESNLVDHMTIHNVGGPCSSVSVQFASVDGGTAAIESFGSGSVTLVGDFLKTGTITVTLK